MRCYVNGKIQNSQIQKRSKPTCHHLEPGDIEAGSTVIMYTDVSMHLYFPSSHGITEVLYALLCHSLTIIS